MDASGRERLRRRLEAIPMEIFKAVEPALMKSADEMASAMRRFAPRDTGALIDSITVTGPGGTTPAYSQPGGSQTVPENSVAITAGNSAVRYGHLVEFGTRKAHAQAFFWPAYRLFKNRAKRRISRAIGKAVREARG
jgi:HK97 gp10 family phage protein